MSKANEWELLKRQFDALVHDEGVDADSMETIFDDPFRHRFGELITQIAKRNSASAVSNGDGDDVDGATRERLT